MKTFSEIVNEIKRIKKVSKDSDVATLIGLKAKALALRKMRGRIPIEKLAYFCRKEEISFDLLVWGEAIGVAAERRARGVSDVNTTYGDFDFVPVVSGKISAGGGLIPDNSVEIRVAFRREWIERKGNPKNMSLIRVSGDSMEPTLQSGDLVLIDHTRNYIDPHGGIHAILIGDEIMIKRLQILYPSGRVKVISDNVRYEALEVDPNLIGVNGKVIWYGRDLEH